MERAGVIIFFWKYFFPASLYKNWYCLGVEVAREYEGLYTLHDLSHSIHERLNRMW